MGIQKKITENVSSQCFTQKNTKTDGNQPISRSRKTLPKIYILRVFELVTYKKNAKMDTKQSILGNKGTLQEKCIMNVLQFKKKHKAKNAKTRVYAETHE